MKGCAFLLIVRIGETMVVQGIGELADKPATHPVSPASKWEPLGGAMAYVFIVLTILSAALYFLGPWVVALILVPFIVLAKLFMRWLSVGVVVLALGAPAVSRADLLDDIPECRVEDCELCVRSGP